MRKIKFRFPVAAVVILVVALGLTAVMQFSSANTGPSTIIVRARGNLGTERARLRINDREVNSWQLTNTYRTYTHRIPSGSIDQLRVTHSSGHWPNAIIVDYVEVNGVRYESEDSGTLSEGSWDPTNRCAEGYKQSEWLSCNNGYFEYDVQPQGANSIIVRARGNRGSENVDLLVNGSEVASWPVTVGYQTFSYNTDETIDQIRVRHNSGNWPNAVIVDYVEFNGTRYQSEDPGVLSEGSWDSVNRCARGYKQSEWLSCNNGYFEYDINQINPTGSGNTVISVRARGNQGTESADLLINGTEVVSWPVSTSYQTFTFRTDLELNQVRVRHNSGNWPSALVVDYLEVDGGRIQSESSSVRSSGSWDSVNGCAEGYKQSEWLSCNNGYFEYPIGDSGNNNNPPPPPSAPLVIYDTDMGPDIDDALALAMLHTYEDAGLIELAAVTVSRDSRNAAQYIDAVNTYNDRPNVPIGVYRGGTVASSHANSDGFTVIANNYPHDTGSSTVLPDGYRLIRRILSETPASRDVIIIQTGFSGTLSALLNSGGDSSSSLDGRSLVSERVDVLSIMAGRFNSSTPEFNVEKDLSSARNLFARWPVDMVVSDWNIGRNLFYPYNGGVNILPGNSPVRAAYEYRTLSWHRDLDPNPPSQYYNMASWDLTSVLEAIEPDANYFGTIENVTVSLDSRGVSTYRSGGRHTVLTLPSNSQRTINRMIELVR